MGNLLGYGTKGYLWACLIVLNESGRGAEARTAVWAVEEGYI